MLHYARVTLCLTIYLAFMLSGIAAIAILLVWAASFLNEGAGAFLLSWGGISFSATVAIIYIQMRRFIV